MIRVLRLTNMYKYNITVSHELIIYIRLYQIKWGLQVKSMALGNSINFNLNFLFYQAIEERNIDFN